MVSRSGLALAGRVVTVCGATLPTHALPLGSHANQHPIASLSLSAEPRLSGAWSWPSDKGLLAGHILILGQASLHLDAVRPRPGAYTSGSAWACSSPAKARSQRRRAAAGPGSDPSPAAGQRARRHGGAGGNGWRGRGGAGAGGRERGTGLAGKISQVPERVPALKPENGGKGGVARFWRHGIRLPGTWRREHPARHRHGGGWPAGCRAGRRRRKPPEQERRLRAKGVVAPSLGCRGLRGGRQSGGRWPRNAR